jgi:hypothetical protein
MNSKKMFGMFAVVVAVMSMSMIAIPALAAPVMDQLRTRDQLKTCDPLMTQDQLRTCTVSYTQLQTQDKLQAQDQLRTCTQDCTQLQSMDQTRAMDGSCGDCVGTCLNGGSQLKTQSGYQTRVCL